MPAISVIVPFYNESYNLIKRCLDSIREQPFKDYEVIIVNDGSRSENRDCLTQLCYGDQRFKLIDQENCGVSVARNHGIKEAAGEYIVFVDADDFILPGFFEEAYRIAKKSDADVLYSFISRVTVEENSPVPSHKKIEYQTIDDEWLKKYTVGYLYNSNAGIFGRGPWARFLKKECVKTTFFPEDIAIGEDVIWNLDIIANCKKKLLVNAHWYCYVDQESSVTNKYDPAIIERLRPFYRALMRYVESGFVSSQYYSERLLLDCRKYVFKSLYGHKNNRFGFVESWRRFNATLMDDPWSKMWEKGFISTVKGKDKLRVAVIRAGLIYPYWSVIKLTHKKGMH